MKVYKLTDSNDKTKGDTQWGEGVRHEAKGTNSELCSDGWIHWYHDPLLAVLHDPIHGEFGTEAHLWEAKTDGGIREEGRMKGGSKGLTTLRRIDLPTVTTEQRVRYAILCARQVRQDAAWNAWADRWLSGEDRTAEAARAAGAEAARAAAAARSSRAPAAARAAARAAWEAAAGAAAEAAVAEAAWAAGAAAEAAVAEAARAAVAEAAWAAARANIDLVAIARRAIAEEVSHEPHT
jgi:hypothetical protein